MFRTSLQVILSADPDDCEAFDRRRIVRALVDVRRTIEDRTSGATFPPRGESVDLLVDLARRLRLTALETAEALGAEILEDLAWWSVMPRHLSGAEFDAWCAEHEGADVGPLELGHGPR